MSIVINRICDNTVLALRIVVSTPNGRIEHATNLNPAHAYTVLGLAITGGVYGQYATVQYTGVIFDPSWNWDHGYPIFLVDDGKLTQIQPTEGFIYQVGYATTPHEIALRMTLISAVEIDFPYRTAITDSDIVVGQPIYLKADGHLDLGASTDLITANIIGLSASAAVIGETVQYSTDGVIHSENWLPVTGTVILETGTVYYLAETPGTMTATIPQIGYFLKVGTALSEYDFNIELSEITQL